MTDTIELKVNGKNSTVVKVGRRRFYFSYETCVAFHDGTCGVRRESDYSQTTRKHLAQFGATDWRKVPDSEFENLAVLGKVTP